MAYEIDGMKFETQEDVAKFFATAQATNWLSADQDEIEKMLARDSEMLVRIMMQACGLVGKVREMVDQNRAQAVRVFDVLRSDGAAKVAEYVKYCQSKQEYVAYDDWKAGC